MGSHQLQEGTVGHLQQLRTAAEGELMGPDPVKHCCRFNGIGDFSPIVGQRIDERIRQFPLKLNFLGHCRGSSFDARRESFHHHCTIPTVCLEVMSLMTSSRGYNRGESEPRVALYFLMLRRPPR